MLFSGLGKTGVTLNKKPRNGAPPILVRSSFMKQDSQWLEKYRPHLANKNILELGCGSGEDSQILLKLSHSLIAIDKDPQQLQKLSVRLPSIATRLLDIKNPLPYPENTFSAVVASLCLHYFTNQQTCLIIDTIKKFLIPNGPMIVRVNSIKDIHHGAVGHTEVEKGLYTVSGQTKRFFTENDIHTFFGLDWDIQELTERKIDRYEQNKWVWEFIAINR